VLHGGEVGLLWIMHVEEDLLEGVCDVGWVNIRYWRALVRLLK
jgi:hypothetical protein